MRRALVTGANRGIGLEFCRQLAGRGDEVIAVCRQSSPELEATGIRVEAGIDVTRDESVARLAAALDGQTLDLLINNAGILERVSLDDIDLESIRRQFEVNALGPLRVTVGLLDRLRRGSKVALITSLMGSMGDNGSGSHYGYRMSKAALNMAGVSLARDLAPREIAVALLHPGFVRTDMTGGQGNLAVDDSVRGLLARIDALDLPSSGRFWHTDGRELPW
jgi:NAD(P)-dependent dehydrogenase (short-subunit alcohol dehydrogenase family)